MDSGNSDREVDGLPDKGDDGESRVLSGGCGHAVRNRNVGTSVFHRGRKQIRRGLNTSVSVYDL